MYANSPVWESKYHKIITLMNTSILKNYGLNRNDIAVYDALLRLGRSKTGPIIHGTDIVSSRVYESLRILVSRGLVSYQVKNNIKYYQAESPDQLIDEAGKNIGELKTLAKDIDSFSIPLPSRNDANIFEGRHGFKMAFTQHIEHIKRGEKVSIIGFSHRAYLKGAGSRELRSFFTNSDTLMMPKKAHARLLTERELMPILTKERIDSSIYNIKYLPSGYFGPCAVNISETEVLLSVWGESPIVFSIKNPTVVKTFQKNFDFLWGLAKKK
jgi:sugar-specific transcriptional regulator TrmB